jgi:hypothetical protein
MAQLRQDSMFQHSDAHMDCAEYVGAAPAISARCFNRFHSALFKCPVCGWNLCQFCKRSALDVCVQCGLADCEKCKSCNPRKKDPCCLLCHELTYPDFIGWSGVCGGCRKEGKEPAVRSATPAVSIPHTPSFVCVPSLMPVPVEGVSHDEVGEPERSALIRAYEQRRLEGVLTGSQLAGYQGRAPPARLQVMAVCRIENPHLRACFEAHCTLVRAINRTRPEDKQFKGSGIETVFHGTSYMFIKPIIERGFEARYNRTTAYGNHALYMSKYPYVPEMHSVPNHAGSMYVLECEAMIGNNATTNDLGSAPLASSEDSGGDGSGHIYALFNNASLLPKYLYRLKG